MCKYCTSTSSEFEYVNLSDSLTSIGDSDIRSPDSGIERVSSTLVMQILEVSREDT